MGRLERSGKHADYLANLQPQVLPGDIDMPAIVAMTCRNICRADAVLTNGAGNFASWVHRFFRHHGLAKGYKTQLAPTVGAMGYGVPAGIAASHHHRAHGVHDRRRRRFPDEWPGTGHGHAVWRQEHHRAAQQRHVRHHPHAPGARVPAACERLRDCAIRTSRRWRGPMVMRGVRITRTEEFEPELLAALARPRAR
jgi:hypothetical protein